MQTKTEVFTEKAAHNRNAYIEFVDDKVIFDCSDGEYGPIEFDIEILIEKLDLHTTNALQETLNQWIEKKNQSK
jgi:hypothetical protein